MAKMVDARGLSCPQPVILTKQALAEGGEVVTIVDNPTSRMNVSRMAEKQGFFVEVEEKQDGTYLRIVPRAGATAAPEPASTRDRAPFEGPTVFLIGSNTLGIGAEELGTILMRSFLHTLNEVSPLPDSLVFLNSGVQLVIEGSPVLEDLRALVEQGVEVLACGTCLGYYDLKDKVAVGTVSNMYAIAETLLHAGKVISP